jgi:hypothetical protein
VITSNRKNGKCWAAVFVVIGSTISARADRR